MSIRALIGYSAADGTWKAVWNNKNGFPQDLGKWIIKQVKAAGGDFGAVRARYIDDCPGGWSDVEAGERLAEPGALHTGTFDGVVAKCDAAPRAITYDAHYLYLLHAPNRKLFVFGIKPGPIRPFGIVTFDATGTAKPRSLPSVDE